MVEHYRKPSVTVGSPESGHELRMRQQAAIERLEKLAERDTQYDPDQVLAEVTEEVEAVRQEWYEQQRQSESRR